MFEDHNWVNYKDNLVWASLIIQKPDIKGITYYSLLPFMSYWAFEILD